MQIYLDCDGVLADFDGFFYSVYGMIPVEYETVHGAKNFWNAIDSIPDFFEQLPPMGDAMVLWDAVSSIMEPIILTGVPYSVHKAVSQKLNWKNKVFGPNAKMICVKPQNKQDYCKPGDILIDDRLKYAHLWISKNGKFIHHINAEQSLDKLEKMLNFISVEQSVDKLEKILNFGYE